ncbi:DUF2059 domain-containing protein [Marinifilum sp. RC60d5]|uniref:DUF2059 domain-containing protein n=1 Tax=Marinifilum sp. RC60d5 TaxID=3458414 RepID=UPI0040354B1A
MKLNKALLLISVIFISLNSNAHTKPINNEEDAFTKDVKYLFQINGSAESFSKSVKTMIKQLKSVESDVPEKYWEKAEHEFLNTSIDDLMDMIVPVYKKNMSHDDLLAMITFFESEAGKRIAQKIPEITTESMQAGMIWGQTIGKKIYEDIERKGYKIRLPFTP